MVESINIKLPNGKDAICYPTAASVLFLDPVQLAEIINFLISGQFICQNFIQAVIVKQPEYISATPKGVTHAGEAVLVFGPRTMPILPSNE